MICNFSDLTRHPRMCTCVARAHLVFDSTSRASAVIAKAFGCHILAEKMAVLHVLGTLVDRGLR